MLRRCVQELSSNRRRHRQLAGRIPAYLLSRHEFSSASRSPSQRNVASQKPTSENPQAGNPVSKIFFGSFIVGAAALAAYQSGYIDQLRGKDDKRSIKSDRRDIAEHLDEPTASDVIPRSKEEADTLSATANHVAPPSKEADTLSTNMDNIEQNGELYHSEDNVSTNPKDLEAKEETPESKDSEDNHPVKDQGLGSLFHEMVTPPDEEQVASEVPSGISSDVGNDANNGEPSEKQSEITITPNLKDDQGSADHDQDNTLERLRGQLSTEPERLDSLVRSYSLESAESPQVSEEKETLDISTSIHENEEVSSAAGKTYKGGGRPEESKLVLDFIEAIHAAERRQAEADAYIFAEEKRKLKEKYEKELKDARARELMHAEEAAILDKELNKEKAKAAAAIKLLQQKAEQKLHEELKHKEEQAEKELRKAQELAKAELASAIAREKSSQIEKIAEANLSLDALCMAFYARSEEARQSHSVHKLALTTLALGDALSKGLPLQVEVDALRRSLEGIDRDSLLALALSSLPDEALTYGTNTQIQLSEKFDSLKPMLRHFGLITFGGGGILAHAVAHIASSIKVKEDQCGDGIESLISRVERFIVDGKLAEAADALDAGVRGSGAQEVVTEWVRQARNRAVAEQALSLLQSYATSITFS